MYMNGQVLLHNDTLWLPQLIEVNAIHVSDIWDESILDFKPFDEFCIEYLLSHTRKHQNMYNKLIKCIPNKWKTTLKARTYNTVPKEQMFYLLLPGKNVNKVYHDKFTTKIIYSLIMKETVCIPRSIDKWNKIFDTELPPNNVFNNIHKGINEKLEIQIYWKFLHLSLPTKDFLFKCNITNDDLCLFCSERETNIHIFVDCYVAFSLWTQIEYIFKLITGKNVHILNFYTVCFNFDHYWRTIPENTIKLCNFLLITARYCLWQNRNLKMNNKTCNVYRYFINKIKCRIKEEQRSATCKQKKKQFGQLWCINNTLCSVNNQFELSLNID